jgi:HAD superfamily hydrolase (TIGR01509 family)
MCEGNVSAPYQAVVFDLDGVLWDGEPIYFEAFNVVLAPYGHRITMDEYVNIIGHSVEAAWAWVLNHFSITETPSKFYHRYDDAVLEMLRQPVAPLPGARDLIAEIKRRRLPLGLASASLRQWVDATLRGLDLEDEFDATVSASEVENSKPAPDLYLAAAKALEVDPAACIAFEDTRAGIAAAKAAGMFAVQVRASSTALPPIDRADAVIDRYSEFDLALLGTPP